MSGWGQEGSTNMPTELTEEIVNAAIEGFKAQKFRLDQHIAELRTRLKMVPLKLPRCQEP